MASYFYLFLVATLIPALFHSTWAEYNVSDCYPVNRTELKFKDDKFSIECASPLFLVTAYSAIITGFIGGLIVGIVCCFKCSFCFEQGVPENYIG